MSEPRRTSSATLADTKHSWWPGWIWAVPLAALSIGGWLLFRYLTQGGTDITIRFSDGAGISAGDTTILYRGMTVGTVDGISLTKSGDAVEVSATIQDSASKFLTAGTRFWLRGAHPSLSDLSSLGAILSGPTIVMDPGPGKATKKFQGLGKEPVLPRAPGPAIIFAISFEGTVGDLSEGDAVKLRGFTVGEVTSTGFRYDPVSGKIATPVTIALYPAVFHLPEQAQPNEPTAFKGVLDHLVAEGLRANLERDPPLIGGHRVALEMVPGAPRASLEVLNNLPEIPTAPGGGLQSIVDKFKNVPIDQIAQNLLDITKHIDQLAASPKLKGSIAELDASLQEIHQTVQDVGPKVDQLVQSLRDTSRELDQAANHASQTLGGPASQTGLQETLNEMKEAARSVRSLADYLERHPESLIKGKPGD